MDSFTVHELTDANAPIFERLMQNYESEFSFITQKSPLPDGTFPLDITIDDTHYGFVAFVEQIPCGIAVVRRKGSGWHEVAEFFIVPFFRRRGLGFKLFEHLCQRFPGAWEIKQIAGAESATQFWRRTVSRFTGGSFEEDVYRDEYWGMVTRQRFSTELS